MIFTLYMIAKRMYKVSKHLQQLHKARESVNSGSSKQVTASAGLVTHEI